MLPSHVDDKNDHCPGYDHCAVYTFATNVSGRVCRLAVIMASRTAAGVWLENRLGPKKQTKKTMQNKIIQTSTFFAWHASSLIFVLSNISPSFTGIV